MTKPGFLSKVVSMLPRVNGIVQGDLINAYGKKDQKGC